MASDRLGIPRKEGAGGLRKGAKTTPDLTCAPFPLSVLDFSLHTCGAPSIVRVGRCRIRMVSLRDICMRAPRRRS